MEYVHMCTHTHTQKYYSDICLFYYGYVFSTKSVIRAERDLPETEGVGRRWGSGEGGEVT
jgi:hypothetical protein